jgi:hypothetical protein
VPGHQVPVSVAPGSRQRGASSRVRPPSIRRTPDRTQPPTWARPRNASAGSRLSFNHSPERKLSPRIP